MTDAQKQELEQLLSKHSIFSQQNWLFPFIDQLIQRERIKAKIETLHELRAEPMAGLGEFADFFYDLIENKMVKLEVDLKDLTSEKENKFDQKFMVGGKDIKKQLIDLNISKPEQDDKLVG